ncbi:polysaccharide biosynthesis/export family protein [Phormidesmis priestleyi]
MPPIHAPDRVVMSKVFSTRQLTALSLVSVHSMTASVPFAMLFWAAGTSPKAALSQTPLPPSSEPGRPSPPLQPKRPPTSLELVEQARQRLRDRGELSVPTPNPTVVPTAPVVVPVAPVVVPTVPEAPAIVRPTAPSGSFNVYRLGTGDTVSVVVQRFPDLNFQAVIDQEGNITTPLLGKVQLQGLTIDQAQERVRQGVDRYVINPIVLLALTGQRPVLVTMTGEVGRPGQYALQLPRISSALLSAGGITNKADLRSVRVRRTLKDGSAIEESLDLVQPLKDGTPLPDLRLQDGDVVVVSRLEAETAKDYDRELVARSALGKGKITVRYLSYVTGRLQQFDLPLGSTFVDALATIGPNPDNTNLKRVALIRFDPDTKKAITRELDGKKALTGDLAQNVPLEDNDVIVIGRNLVGRITYALNVFTQPFRDVLGFLLFFRELGNSATNLFGPTGRDR